MLKSFVQAGLLLGIGAGLGIWFAPPSTKGLMKEKLTFAQTKAKDFHINVSSDWFAGAKKTLDKAPKVDFKKLNQREFSAWIQSVEKAYASVSEQAVQTQKSVNAINRYLEGAKTEYKKQHERFMGI